MKQLKQLKKRIGSLICFSFILQSIAPLIASVPMSSPPKTQQIQSNKEHDTDATIIDTNLNKFIKQIVEEAATENVAHNLSESLQRCYKKLSQGETSLSEKDIWLSMPDMVRYIIEWHKTRAARPTIQEQPDLIVGPQTGTADISQVLDVLAAIKSRIGCVTDPVCCNTILGVLGNACELFGPDCSISCKLLEIMETIIETRTEIIATLTECCESLHEEIFNTQTTLAADIAECCEELSEEIFNTQTTLAADIAECCEEIREDIFNTQTIIAECCESLHEEIFNTQTTLAADIAECCEELSEEIFNTQTTLAADIAECCEHIISTLCPPIPLRQSDVIGGELLITQSGDYKFCENITANLLIVTPNVSIDMNDYHLYGIVLITGNDVILKNGYIEPPAPTAEVRRICSIDHAPIIPAAITIEQCVINTYIQNITIQCANSIAADIDGNGIDGRSGIYTNGVNTFIEHCNIKTGTGAPGLDSPSVPVAGRGGNGGDGIIFENDTIIILKTIITTGNGGNGGTVDIGGSGVGADGGKSGTGISIFGNNASIFDCEIFSGNGAFGGSSCCSSAGNGGNSGNGIYNDSQTTVIKNIISRTGNGGNGGSGSSGNNGGNGGNSGHAIETQGTQITNALLSTGNGGFGGDGDNGGNGGNAGYGLYVHDACRCEVRSIVVEFTGAGGNGGNSTMPSPFVGNGGNGGSGADAVHIAQTSKNTEIRFSTFSNTGAGGLGGSPANGGTSGNAGAPGRAVTDLNNDLCSIDPLCSTTLNHPSVIFENFAYAISDTTIRYLLNGKVQESGKASNASCNRLDNVYVNCDVNETFDICAELVLTQTTLVECCESLHEDIFNTQTTLATNINECCEELSQDILNTQNTLTACCEEIESNFEGTFSVLQEIETTLTTCCASVQEVIGELSNTSISFTGYTPAQIDAAEYTIISWLKAIAKKLNGF